jgi:hypothetical protein
VLFRSLVKDDDLEFPVRDAQIQRTEKGTLVMRPADCNTVYLVEIKSGYRGSASINEITGGEVVASGNRYHSGQGALGSTAWAIVNSPTDWIKVTGRRTGRRVDENDVAFYLYPDGHRVEAINDELEKLL